MLYVFINVIIFFLNPYSSPWHYQDHEPKPIAIQQTGDVYLTADRIESILDEIDLAYGGRPPHISEKITAGLLMMVQVVFFPSTIALSLKSFVGYMGPANEAQQAFTISVKIRYNYLVQICPPGSLKNKHFLFRVEPSLTKKNGDLDLSHQVSSIDQFTREASKTFPDQNEMKRQFAKIEESYCNVTSDCVVEPGCHPNRLVNIHRAQKIIEENQRLFLIGCTDSCHGRYDCRGGKEPVPFCIGHYCVDSTDIENAQ